MIKYECAVVGALHVNCYLVYCDRTMHGIVIDPGANINKITQMIENAGVTVDAVVLTHAHFDHSAHADDIRKKYNIPIIINEYEKEILQDPYLNLSSSFTNYPISTEADIFVKNGDKIKFGECGLTVIHTPGHTSGSMSLYGEGILFAGDTLFCDSHGRTDFPTGDDVTLAESIKRLFELDDATVLNAGHNESSTLGREKHANYLVRILLGRGSHD